MKIKKINKKWDEQLWLLLQMRRFCGGISTVEYLKQPKLEIRIYVHPIFRFAEKMFG